MNTATIVSKVWSFCTTLRDDGVSYGDYLEQLTYLIFLKMADEYSKPPYNRDMGIPQKFSWQTLQSKNKQTLERKQPNTNTNTPAQTPTLSCRLAAPK